LAKAVVSAALARLAPSALHSETFVALSSVGTGSETIVVIAWA
jgi:hypothetical protein